MRRSSIWVLVGPPKTVAFLFGTLLLLPSVSHAQDLFPRENAGALAGVESFDAQVSIQSWNWLGMEGDQERFRDSANTAFQSGLRRAGVMVTFSVENVLFCRLKLANAEGLIVYSYEISFYEWVTAGLHRLLWSRGGIVRVGRDDFSAEDVAGTCVDAFTSEWHEQNPAR